MNKWKEDWGVLELKQLKQVEITMIGNRELIKVSTIISGVQKKEYRNKNSSIETQRSYLYMFFCNMYTDTNTQKEVQKATGEHTTDNGNSEERLDGNRLTRSFM